MDIGQQGILLVFLFLFVIMVIYAVLTNTIKDYGTRLGSAIFALVVTVYLIDSYNHLISETKNTNLRYGYIFFGISLLLILVNIFMMPKKIHSDDDKKQKRINWINRISIFATIIVLLLLLFMMGFYLQ